MLFQVNAHIFRKPPEDLSLGLVWDIKKDELSPLGDGALHLLNSDQFTVNKLPIETAWTSQALLEFQDLQGIGIPKKGRYFHLNYLFFEALSALRESILTGLNGFFHASFSVLRSAIELFVFHYWWRRRLLGADNYENFYDWLFGNRKSAPFMNILEDCYRGLDIPEPALKENDLKDVYATLCSYVHKPLIYESITSLRGGNDPSLNSTIIEYWLVLIQDTQRCLLDLAIAESPESLFPVELHRKFGFNPPLGFFFDYSNFLSIEQAIGKELVEVYREYFKDKDPPRGPLNWFRGLDDLSDEAVLSSWSGEQQFDDEDKPFEERVLVRYAVLKAKMRALLMMMSYGKDAPDVDFTRSIASIMKEIKINSKIYN